MDNEQKLVDNTDFRKMAIETRARIAKAVFADKVSSRDIDEVEYKIIEQALRTTAEKHYKQGYKDADRAIACEYRDPNGTIWEWCEKVQKENAGLKAELDRLRKEPSR